MKGLLSMRSGIMGGHHVFATQATAEGDSGRLPSLRSPVLQKHELAQESFVGFLCQAAGPCYDHMFQLCGFTPHIIQEVTDSALLLGLIATNVAMSLLPASPQLLQHRGV